MANSKTPAPFPLFPPYEQLRQATLDDYPTIKQQLVNGPDWQMHHWHWAKEFLAYTGRNKSEHTYTRFRNEVERFLLWSYVIKEAPLDTFKGC